MNNAHEELIVLANLYCEEQLGDDQLIRLQDLLRSSGESQSLFIEFVQLHGQLTWSGGVMPGNGPELIASEDDVIPQREVITLSPAFSARKADDRTFAPAPVRRSLRAAGVALASLTAAVLISLAFRSQGEPQDSADLVSDASPVNGAGAAENVDTDGAQTPVDDLPPLKLDGVQPSEAVVRTEERLAPLPHDAPRVGVPDGPSDAEIVAEIDRMIESVWQENNATPAAAADDHEWIRRTYLTLTGRIPSIEEVSDFVGSESPRKRDELLNQLLTSRRASENLAVIWTNLLIGRSNSRDVDQKSLFGFLLKQFDANKPWMDTVGRLIAAEGRSDQNGATNFLLAHLNDQATPATAVTARLFLGQQVHCTQCHDHPFAKERQQQEFWSLNAFFKQAERKQIKVAAEDGTTRDIWTLADSGKTGMTYYDTLRGQTKAVLPEFSGESLPAETEGSRRGELVRLLAADSEHQVARAMVNRMWAQFFGYGFTNPIDDLGAHNPVSHSELYDYLTNAFVKSDYDLHRLMRWLAMSRSFGLSSVQSEAAYAVDDPQEGGMPLFSRIYPRHMVPEQVYESIRIAIRSVSDQPIDSSLGTEHRREWVDQFVQAYGTDENDEQLAFEGNISQALLMMNNEDLTSAIPLAAMEVTKALQNAPVTAAPERLALATVNRRPTENESKAFRNRFRALSRSLPADQAMKTATEDMLWAYLNCSEFVSVH